MANERGFCNVENQLDHENLGWFTWPVILIDGADAFTFKKVAQCMRILPLQGLEVSNVCSLTPLCREVVYVIHFFLA